ncbi:hypothetical protein DY000_02059366 [Brassica cretica]|uniref:Uncharacterized protein n=1 Tax=Brassica cretica TaxID=69181 RepID=A0ABQ7ASV2_BRACR|nr:hypothetical protein DY000_02059366 [Brassica cretica]
MCYKKILPLVIAPERFHTSAVATEVVATVGHREDTGGKKKCVCSPWKHPRSFKCRQSSFTSSSALSKRHPFHQSKTATNGMSMIFILTISPLQELGKVLGIGLIKLTGILWCGLVVIYRDMLFTCGLLIWIDCLQEHVSRHGLQTQ